MTIKVFLADDHPMIRKGLRALLESEPGFQVVGEAADGLEAVEKVIQCAPEVLVVDLMMPGLNGLEVTHQLHQRMPRTRIIILSMHADEAYVLKALQHGALGYVIKDADEEELLEAVRQVSQGKRYLSGPISERLVEAYLRQASETAAQDPYESLTGREREILQLAAQGQSNVEIANRLHISQRTASTHRANLMRKLNLHNQTDLVRFAMEHGL